MYGIKKATDSFSEEPRNIFYQFVKFCLSVSFLLYEHIENKEIVWIIFESLVSHTVIICVCVSIRSGGSRRVTEVSWCSSSGCC